MGACFSAIFRGFKSLFKRSSKPRYPPYSGSSGSSGSSSYRSPNIAWPSSPEYSPCSSWSWSPPKSGASTPNNARRVQCTRSAEETRRKPNMTGPRRAADNRWTV